jgi:putative membrane protein insertion efficiency factor
MNLRQQIISMPARMAIVLVRVYQWGVSPVIHAICGPSCGCRFHPTCSEYARVSLRDHGLVRGSFLALRRLLRCHPWQPGGIDPVPAPVSDRSAIFRKSDDLDVPDLKTVPLTDIPAHFKN